MWLILLRCLKSVANDIQDLSARDCGELLAEGREDALLPWEEGLAEATMLCKAVCELAMPLPSPEDAPLWDFIGFLFSY